MRLFRPVWENRDNPDKALRAVSRIKSQKKLKLIALDELTCDTAKAEAIDHIVDEDMLLEIGLTVVTISLSVSTALTEMVRRLQDSNKLLALVAQAKEPIVRRTALDRINDPVALAQIAQQNSDDMIRVEALRRIDDTAVLAQAAKVDPRWEVRVEALKKLGMDTEANTLIALKSDPQGRIQAVLSGKIGQDLLLRICREDRDAEVRRAAMQKLSSPGLLAVFLEEEHPLSRDAGYRLVQKSTYGDADWITEIDEAALQKLTDRCFERKSVDACTLLQHIYRSGRFQEHITRLNGRMIREEKHNDSESHYQDLGDHVDYGHNDSMIPPEIFTLE